MSKPRTLETFDDGTPEAPPPPRIRPPPLPGVWQVHDGWVVHPLLAPETIRALPFQLDLARVAIADDLLVVLPTGLGKTVIAALAAAEVARRDSGKVLVLAPTRPLVLQHAEAFHAWLPSLRTARFTGTVRKPVREGGWDGADVVFATPEVVANDLAADRYSLADVGLIVFDEAHHTVGHYAYVAVAERFRRDRRPAARLLGLTASPGGQQARIDEVVGILGVRRVEARHRDEPGVREYVQPVDVEHRWVDLPPEIQSIQAALRVANLREGRALQRIGYLRKKPLASISVKDLVALRAEVFARPGPMVRKFGPLFHQLVLLHLHHALERLETQGVEPFVQYVERVEAKPKPSRGDRAFLKVPELAQALAEAKAILATAHSTSHPKIDALRKLVAEEFERPRDRPPRILVFAQFRDTIQGIRAALDGDGWSTGRFVGQSTRDADDPGMSQGDQSTVLREFRTGRFPILVASSVAEEGLDVPDVDLVVFFESVASEIRAIQRRGRTGRSSLGRVVLLLTRDTRDVGYEKAEQRREEAMVRIVRRMSRDARRARASEGTPAPPDGPDSPVDPPQPARAPRRTSVAADK
ncbi:MAG: DEAD/DEAH box helicase family protein [Thermoplasmata archaeon]|nr:DEAD/DEAH box helicase family protein [Thermoplasmata archaeon]